MSKRYIDLNCDMGESFGVYKLGMDEEVIKLISSANVACGFHGGDPNVMDRTVAMAKEYGVGIGVHMGFPDLLGFGRRNMDIAREDLMNLIIYQIGALDAFCRKHGTVIQHVKPHGNMNNMADTDEEMAENIVDAILAVLPDVPIFVKPNSQLHRVAEAKGLPFVLELFPDRAYNNDLTLVSRRQPGAVVKDPEVAAERAVRMVTEGRVTSITGDTLEVRGETICVHGDTPTALEIVRRIREKFDRQGIVVAPISQWWKSNKRCSC
ncbi:lactam utilization protein LamB [Kyrpidia spormannii]|uniref:5-oxoprolinase subunit A n=3 Tax=Kyrpidia TaxID=1129704 RepID=A0A2K8N2T2_9BACL|nr:5-oxoprolinase subunit PxpA [Kyrpidia spormannii]ATY83823.1 lactam utilization protein LamB [Kyrpidia spormannii]CAB3389540.1 oxoprolinase subunit A [Kyrpidia spormannii]CAB3390372.1 oxoprolinase subunit A [Kyrpidia spormannii]